MTKKKVATQAVVTVAGKRLNFAMPYAEVMPLAAYLRLPANPIQRNTELHWESAAHVQGPLYTSHLVVHVAELPKGERRLLDGHMRQFEWQQRAARGADVPSTVLAVIHPVASLDATMELYKHFDNKVAVETRTQQVTGAYRLYNIVVHGSKFIVNGRYVEDLKRACAGQPFQDVYKMVEHFQREIPLLAKLGVSRQYFPGGILAAALLTLKSDSALAAEFWQDYRHYAITGSHAKVAKPQAPEAARLLTYLRDRETKTGGGAAAAAYRRALTLFGEFRLRRQASKQPVRQQELRLAA